ncbi:MAG: hypothetical protein FWE91_12340 [Defluviitaleaceae bacterium]|nr:hypothetical protein [Defluviitaleaceae bacterium]MCL2836539.1 hypothetical protein [Defluviitaleaceae bacterium]
MTVTAVPESPDGLYVDDIFFVVSLNGGSYIYENRVFVKHGDDISVMPVFIIGGVYYSDSHVFTLNGEVFSAIPPPNVVYGLYTISPVYIDGGYDNFTLAPKNQFLSYMEPIAYSYTRLNKLGVLQAGDIFTNGYGAYYIQAVPGNSGRECFERLAPIFLENGILQIVYRGDDSYLGYLSELMHSPFIMYPKNTAYGHQTDLLIGSDCAAFVIYGMRRMGLDIPYCGPQNIHKYLIPLSDDDTIKPGDILHYGSHLAVYYENKGMADSIDDDDILLQSYGPRPHYTTVGENAAMFGIHKVYRYPE